MTATLIDTHAHLQDPKIAPDIEAVLARAAAAGVAQVLVAGYDLPSSEAAVELARQHSGIVLAAAGIHPHEADGHWEDELARLHELCADPAVVLVGELGLDAVKGFSTESRQRELLAAQLEIALAVRKPVAVHSRGAERDILRLLEPFAASARASGLATPGVMHCFGGSLEDAEPYVEMGFFISIAGPVTYPRNEATRRLAAGLPARSLVIETDSPYLPPQGMRGQRNEPAWIVETARAVAAARGGRFEDVAELTTANARLLLSAAATGAAAR